MASYAPFVYWTEEISTRRGRMGEVLDGGEADQAVADEAGDGDVVGAPPVGDDEGAVEVGDDDVDEAADDEAGVDAGFDVTAGAAVDVAAELTGVLLDVSKPPEHPERATSAQSGIAVEMAWRMGTSGVGPSTR